MQEKSYSPFSVSRRAGRGESSSSKCPRPAQVDFNNDFRVVGLNPGREFPKNALIPRISNYVYIQPLGHKKECCEGLCKSI